MTQTITLAEEYAYSQYKFTGTGVDIIDASDASWIVSNIGDDINRYPFYLGYSNSGIQIIGGTIYGEIPLTLDWIDAYVNSAAVIIKHTADVTIQDWRIMRPWDGIRISGDTSTNFEIKDNWITEARDDAIENDTGVSGTITNSLLDGAFSGISLGNKNIPDSSDNIITIDGVLIRMESYLYKGNMSHGSPIKMIEESQSLRIFDSIFAIEDVNHLGQGRTELTWDKTIEASGNYFLNLSDTLLPNDYPVPGQGWTILQGVAARDYWEEARSDWIAEHMNSTLAGTNVSENIYGTEAQEYILGLDGNDTLFGYGGDDAIDGSDGNDFLYGGTGVDTLSGGNGIDSLTGGAGNDTLNGGDGDDSLNGGVGDDFIDGGTGNDTIDYFMSSSAVMVSLENNIATDGEGGTDTLRDIESIRGSNYNDILIGNDAHSNTIWGGLGNDEIQGRDGNDILYGEEGIDELKGGNGNDILYGGDDKDVLYGHTGNDTVYGDGGDDSLYGHEGDDMLRGGRGIDKLYGDDGLDVLVGGSGLDFLYGGSDSDKDVFAFSADEDSYDRIYNFDLAIDEINITNLLTGYVEGTSDIADFVEINHAGSRFDIKVDRDGGGDNYVNTARVLTNIDDSITATDMWTDGALIANEIIF